MITSSLHRTKYDVRNQSHAAYYSISNFCDTYILSIYPADFATTQDPVILVLSWKVLCSDYITGIHDSYIHQYCKADL